MTGSEEGRKLFDEIRKSAKTMKDWPKPKDVKRCRCGMPADLVHMCVSGHPKARKGSDD